MDFERGTLILNGKHPSSPKSCFFDSLIHKAIEEEILADQLALQEGPFVFKSIGAQAKLNMATLRNLKIKTGTCKRILKELHSYEKEVEKETAKTADMKEKGADPYDLKQQEELKESNQQGPEIEEAQSIIAEVEALFQSTEG
ncbi:tubulin-folding cofactor A-like isoform X3 [Magnolia sinica]|uniref:tubulin-folding cofactor A-like isoform X3 n=1 Tax=Magnolia sinica TaxID=86752 RepID=UPI002658E099|nr:tubulin-folding cofactor A-like isoform X3 [Magnolia sinica]